MPAKRRFQWLGWVFLAAVIAGGGFGWQWYSQRSKDTTLDYKDYKTNVVARGDIVQSVTANGQINPVKDVQVGSQVSGIITEIGVDFNSPVTNGQMIARIDPSTYEQALTETEAQLASTRAALELAELNYRRSTNLWQNKMISDSDCDQAKVNLDQAAAAVKVQEATMQRAKVDLSRTTIYAPVDGIVISRNVDVGQTVAASFSTPTLFLIANDLTKMQIEAMVSEADVGGVEVGQHVDFTVDAFPERKFGGTVLQVRYAPITNQNVVNYTTVVEVKNPDLKLRPGMTANASIITAQRTNVLRLPNAALRFRPPETALVKGRTNAPAGATNRVGTMLAAKNAAGTNLAAAGPEGGGGSPGSAGFGEGGARPNREEMRRRFENMTPEQREQFRASMRARFGDGPPGGGAGFGGSARGGQDAPGRRVVHVFDKDTSDPTGKPVLKPVTIRTGITDGNVTEVLEGLNEGDVLVTGVNTPAATAGPVAQRPGSNPFGPPMPTMRPR